MEKYNYHTCLISRLLIQVISLSSPAPPASSISSISSSICEHGLQKSLLYVYFQQLIFLTYNVYQEYVRMEIKIAMYLLLYKLRSESDPDVDISISFSNDIWTEDGELEEQLLAKDSSLSDRTALFVLNSHISR